MQGSVAAPLLIGLDGTLRHGLQAQSVDDYWETVSRVLFEVLGAGHAREAVASLRARLNSVDFETQIHFYHSSPLQVASDLVGMPIEELSEAQLASYRGIISAFDPTVRSSAP